MISGSDLFDFAQCNHRVYLNTHGDKELKVALDPATQKLLQDGFLHEAKVVEGMEFAHVTEDLEKPAKVELTAKLMASAAPLIYHGRLEHGSYAAEPDFLKLEDGVYIPADIKSAINIRHEHLLQLYFYIYILGLVTGNRPAYGYIIDGGKEWHRFDFGEAEETKILSALARIEEIHNEKWTDGPTLVSHCKKCPWQEHCLEYMKLNEDVSLVHRLGKTDKMKLHDAGIKTLTDIVGLDAKQLELRVGTIPGWRLARYRIGAEAVKKGEEIMITTPKLPKAGTEVYFDIETEASFDVCYLFGLLRDTGGEPEFTAFTAKTPEEEGRAWNEFVDYLEGLPADVAIYHWAPFEVMWMNKLAKKYGITESAQAKIDDNFYDLHKITERSIAFPLASYSLKDVARHLGFSWRDTEVGGALSMLWYLEWLESKDEAKFDQILRYNEDDVRATLHVKRWLETIRER